MGLDILLSTNDDAIFLRNDYDSFRKHSLSRTFCNLMCRRDTIVNEEPELDQIGEITGADISVLYDMNNYPSFEEVEFFLEAATDENEQQEYLNRVEAQKQDLSNNLDKVTFTVDSLIDNLSHINNLVSLLLPTERDTIGREKYFKDFKVDKGDGYIGNNFGQDMRNFKNFLDYAKNNGATGVHFNYG